MLFDAFAREPFDLPLDAALIVHGHIGTRLLLIASGWHRIEGHNELIDPPQSRAVTERSPGAISEPRARLGDRHVERRARAGALSDAVLVGLLRCAQLFVREIVRRVQPHYVSR